MIAEGGGKRPKAAAVTSITRPPRAQANPTANGRARITSTPIAAAFDTDGETLEAVIADGLTPAEFEIVASHEARRLPPRFSPNDRKSVGRERVCHDV